MTAVDVRFNLVTVLLIVATALFVLGAIRTTARPWMIPIGLACFSGAFWAARWDA